MHNLCSKTKINVRLSNVSFEIAVRLALHAHMYSVNLQAPMAGHALHVPVPMKKIKISFKLTAAGDFQLLACEKYFTRIREEHAASRGVA